MNSVNIARLLLGLLLLIQQVSLGTTNSESQSTTRSSPTSSSLSHSTSATIPTTKTPTTSTTTTPTAPTTTTSTTTTSTTTTPTTTAAPSTTISTSTTPLPPTTTLPTTTITLPTTSLPKSTTVAPPANNEQTTALDKQVDDNIDLKTENQRLKIAVGILTAIIVVAVLFAVAIIYIRKRNNVDMRRQEKVPRPNYFRPISNFSGKKSQLDPALEHLHDDRLFVNDLDKEMKTFRLNRGGNVMTSEL